MSRFLLLLFALVVSVLCSDSCAQGQMSGSTLQTQQVSQRYSWGRLLSEEYEYRLYDNNWLRGIFRCNEVGKDGKWGVFRYVYDNMTVIDPCSPPCEITDEMKQKCASVTQAKNNDSVKTTDGEKVPTGVQWDKIDPIAPDEHYHVTGGKKVNRETALQKIKQINGPLPDYGSRLHLTPVGSKEFRDRVRKDFEASQLKERTVFHDVDPSDPRESWILDCGFKKDGEQLYLQDATGGVIARLEAYEGPEALRKIDPNYKPDKDPDPTKPKPILPGLPTELPPWVPGPVAALITFLLTPAIRKEPS